MSPTVAIRYGLHSMILAIALGRACEAQTLGGDIRAGFEQSLSRFTEQANRNPLDARGHIGVAEAHIHLWCFGFISYRDAMPQAKQAALRAIELDSALAEAHTILGVVRLSDWEWAAAEQEFRRAIALDRTQAKSHHWYALYLAAMGRHDEALAESKAAVALDPSAGYQVGLGAILYFGHKFPAMIEQMEQTVAKEPRNAFALDWLGMAYVQERRFGDSINAYTQAAELSGGLAEIMAGFAHAHGQAGDHAKARAILKELETASQKHYVPPVQLAFVYVGLGEHERALDLLETAFEQRSWELVFLQVEPWLEPLSKQARFQELKKRLKFPAPAA